MKTTDIRELNPVRPITLSGKPSPVSSGGVAPLKNSPIAPTYRFTSDSTPSLRLQTEPFTNQFSLSFDGTNDEMDAGVISALQNASAFSFSVWFRAGASGEYPAFGGFSSGTDMVSAYGFNNNLLFSVRGGHETRYEVNTSVLPTDTTSFHHYVYTFSSGTFKVYVDGVEKPGTVFNAGTTSTGTANFNFKIGFQGFHYDQGLYDEFAIFSSALSASNVSSIYNSGEPNDISSLNPVSWWRADNDGGTGTTITDQGSGGNNGTLVNGPTFSSTVPS